MRKIISVLALMAADVLSLIVAFHLAYFLRVNIIQDLFNISNPWFFPIQHFYKMYYLLLVFILIFSYEKLYTYHRRYYFSEEFVFIARGLFISVVLIALLVYLSRTYELFTRAIPILMMFIGMFIVPGFRFLVKKLLMAMGLYTKYTAVIGKEKETAEVIPTLKKLEALGYKITDVFHIPGVEDQDRARRRVESDSNLLLMDWKSLQKKQPFPPYPGNYGNPRRSDKSAERWSEGPSWVGVADPLLKKVDTLVIVSRGLEKEQLNNLINQWEHRVKEIKIISDSSYLKTLGVETEYVEELLVMRMSNKLLSPFNRFLKRGFDLAVSLIVALLLLPFFLVIALLVKIDSRGPVLFIQERFKREQKKFKLLKFRTMWVNPDIKLKEYLRQHPEYQEEWDLYKKLKSFDPRVTRIGKFLRRFSIDEFPQILNVLKGDMSIVGPRPYLPREKEDIERFAAIIFRVKSGLTGLWQIKGRNDLDFETRLKLDEFYVRNWSFFLDITIILKTFGVVIKGKGAY